MALCDTSNVCNVMWCLYNVCEGDQGWRPTLQKLIPYDLCQKKKNLQECTTLIGTATAKIRGDFWQVLLNRTHLGKGGTSTSVNMLILNNATQIITKCIDFCTMLYFCTVQFRRWCGCYLLFYCGHLVVLSHSFFSQLQS